MAAHSKNGIKINLIPSKNFDNSTKGRVLYWLLTTLRIIVILTDLVVMGAFFSKFWLDAKDTNLTEDIQKAQSRILASSTFEQDFRDVQAKTAIFKKYSQEDKEYSNIVDLIKSYSPENLIVTSVRINSGTVTIEGLSLTERDISQFMVNLKDKDFVDKVTLTTISSTEDNIIYSFMLNVETTYSNTIETGANNES